ncbi:MAG: bifunctional sugar phosphate isomerase/epimerase/4-hydroxyphenylpyruvate dioxygenase family protein, partial [Paracoccaceae bacterium]
LSKRAAKRALRVAYLAVPWGRHIQTEMQALDLVQEIDSPHFGLALNSLFSLADGSKPARLRDIPGDKVFHVQLSDAPFLDSDIRHLKQYFGMLPGQGVLNLTGFIRVLAKNGYLGNWSLSCLGEAARQKQYTNFTTDGYRALVNLLDQVMRTDPSFKFRIPALPERIYATGFEFIEFACDEASGAQLTELLSSLCFRMERRHLSKSVELWRQGAINIVVNTEEEGFAHSAFVNHGPSVCDMGLRVKDAAKTVERASTLGAKVFSQPVGVGELNIPAIRGVGGDVIHFIDEKSNLHRVWDIEFDPVEKTQAVPPAGLRRIDHIAQTMKYDEMQSWMLYFVSTFEMEKSSVVDVADPSGIVLSQVIESPEGEVRLNLNGADSQQTFAGAFLADKVGAGVQHMAFLTDDIFETSDLLKASGFPRLEISANYYSDLQSVFDLEPKFVSKLKDGNILYSRRDKSEYFQIYSIPIFDGLFFEVVQRKNGYQGYGARNAPTRLAAQMKYNHPNGIAPR